MGQLPPARFYEPSRRPYPTELLVPEYPDFDKQRWVSDGGSISWRNHPVKISPHLAGEPVGMRQISDSCWEVVYGSRWLGILDYRDAPPKLRHELPAKAEQGTEDNPTKIQRHHNDAAGSRVPALRTVLPELTEARDPELADCAT